MRSSTRHGIWLLRALPDRNLVVIVILSILGGLAAQTLLSRPDAARVQAAQTDLRTLSAALDVYRLDNYRYPRPIRA